MARRQTIADAVREEREAVIEYGRSFARAVAVQISKGRLTAEEGTALKRRINAFVDSINEGLHRNG